MSENLATILTDTAAEHGDRTAMKLDDAELSYSDARRGDGARGRAACARTAWSPGIA